MPYVHRLNGVVVGLYYGPNEFSTEWLDGDDPEVLAFLNPPPLPPPPYTLQMSDFWSRFADDDEYELFDAALSVALPAKDRRAFNAAQFLKSDANLFAWAKVVLVGVVGETRAEVIMAPSEAARGIADE